MNPTLTVVPAPLANPVPAASLMLRESMETMRQMGSLSGKLSMQNAVLKWLADNRGALSAELQASLLRTISQEMGE